VRIRGGAGKPGSNTRIAGGSAFALLRVKIQNGDRGNLEEAPHPGEFYLEEL
jgi:hypothetical protein